jgi:septum site-determining protein MinD
VDANFSAPNLAMYLGLMNLEKSVYNVLKDDFSVTNAIHQYQENLDVLPAALKVRKVDPFKLRKKLDSLRESYDFILIDSSPNLNHEMLATMVAADELLVITNPDHTTLSATLHAVKVAKKKHTPITGIILNKVRNKKFELNIEEIESAAGVPVLSVLPDDTKVLEALSTASPVLIHSPKSNVSVEYKKLAACLIGEKYEDARLLSRIKNAFSKTISKDDVNRAVVSEKNAKKLDLSTQE